MTSVAAMLRRRLAPVLLAWASAAPLCWSVLPTRAQSQTPPAPAKLVVGTMRVPPFVLRSDDGRWSGLSIDLWKQIAAEMNVPYEFREFDYDFAGLLDAVE